MSATSKTVESPVSSTLNHTTTSASLYIYYISLHLLELLGTSVGFTRFFLVFSDYGEKENADLADKYGITKEQYPVYRLFLNGDLEGIPYKGDTKRANDIKKFLMTEAGNIL